MKNLTLLYAEEDSKLSEFAVKNSETEERFFPEPPHPYRLPLHRDRDRIFHSRAFKRLEYKTQVFINSEGDNFRTRLTHTLEVAGISRTVSTALGLNSNLAEVISLAHDLGHTPFGHAGQDILSNLMRESGGFEHNKQSLRIVRSLENRYPEFPGLNLCRMTLIGLLKHGSDYEKTDLYIMRQEQGPSLEALVSDISDEIAYTHHDIEDGLERNLINAENLKQCELWRKHYLESYELFSHLHDDLIIRKALRSMMNEVVTDLIETTERSLFHLNIMNRKNLGEAWKRGERPVGYSKEISPLVIQLKNYLKENLYQHEKVVNKSRFGQKIIEFLFYYLIKNNSNIPDNYKKRAEQEGIHRAISDYISGMTDRYAELKAKEFGFIE
jgi:dGTPase